MVSDSTARSAAWSLAAMALANLSPAVVMIGSAFPASSCPLVAEGGGRLVADPLPQRDGAAQGRVLKQRVPGELLSVEVDRADQVADARVGVPPDKVGQRRAVPVRLAHLHAVRESTHGRSELG